MVSILQPRAMPYESFGQALLLAGSTVSARTATGFEISGSGWTWMLSGRNLTYDANANPAAGLIEGFRLYRGDPAAGTWVLTADTNFSSVTPGILTQALTLHAAGQTTAAAALLNETLLAEPYGHTRYVGGPMHGTTGDDYLVMGGPPSRAYGYGGEDSINFGAANDLGYGGDGRDWLRGAGGDDRLWGDGEADVLFGDDGNDRLSGGDDDDALAGGRGDDQLFGGAGDDGIQGGIGRDSAWGADGNDRIEGEGGDDRLFGQAGNDSIEGGTGSDILGGGQGNDRLLSGADNDVLTGDGGDDTLFGNAGDDLLSGGAGNDLLYGGIGNDTLSGDTGINRHAAGAGADTFVIRGGAAGLTQDVIVDYAAAEDTVMLSGFGFATVDDALALAVDTAGGVLFTFAPNRTLLVMRTETAILADDILLG